MPLPRLYLAAGLALALAACGGEPQPDYLTQPPHTLSEGKRALALFAKRQDPDHVRRGALHCEPHLSGNSRQETQGIAVEKAHAKLGNPPVKHRSTGLVHLIRTWYCALVVPAAD